MAQILIASVGTARPWTDPSISLSSTLSSVHVGSVCGISDHAFYPRQMVLGWCEEGGRGAFRSCVFRQRKVLLLSARLWTDACICLSVTPSSADRGWGRREAAQTVGDRWIDGLWPEFCQNIWESAPVVEPLVHDRGSSLDGWPHAVWRWPRLCGSCPRGPKLVLIRRGRFEPLGVLLAPRRDSSHPVITLLPLGGWPHSLQGSYLVDPASSHMLVSKIKPCMSKYKQSIQ